LNSGALAALFESAGAGFDPVLTVTGAAIMEIVTEPTVTVANGFFALDGTPISIGSFTAIGCRCNQHRRFFPGKIVQVRVCGKEKAGVGKANWPGPFQAAGSAGLMQN
jgi:hypothetical protein